MDSTKLIVAAIAVISLSLAFVGGRSVEEGVQKKHNEQVMAQKLGALSSERDMLRNESVAAKQGHSDAKATVVALREKLKSQNSMRIQDEADLRLYRRIANLDESEQKGLLVDKVTMSKDFESGEVSLSVLLIQTQGRNRVRGSVGASLLPDTGKRINVVAAGTDNAPDFNLRFFQTVHIPLPKTQGVMDELELQVKPLGKAHEPFTYRIPWADIERLR